MRESFFSPSFNQPNTVEAPNCGPSMSGLYAVDLEGGIPALESKRKLIGATKVVISPRTAFSSPEIVPRYILNLVTSVEIVVFFFNDPATTEIYTLSLHDIFFDQA